VASVWEAMKKKQAEQAAQDKVNVADKATVQDIPSVEDKEPIGLVPGPGIQSPGAALPGLNVASAKVVASLTATAAGSPTPRYSEILRPHFDRGGRIAEEYRALRTNLLAQCGGKGFCYLVTSAQAGEGKTLTVLNLALVLGECTAQNVLVIEADMRRPRIAKLLDMPVTPGLSELLRGDSTLKQVIHPTSYSNFSVLPAGRADGDEVGELLGREPMHTLLGEARRGFDFVLIDTPPINLVSDAGALGRFCPEALVVVRMGKTRQDAIDRALSLLRSANIKPAGMILTGSNEPKPPYPHRYVS